MGEDAVMTVNANPNIPEEVRAVAADGTQLRYALMEMARDMDDVIALGRGDPDLDTPPHIVEAAKSAIRDGRVNPTPVKGMDELRKAIAERMRAVNGLPVAAENVMITTGGQEGLFLAIQALIDPGDEILVPDPRYSSYDDAIRRAGGTMVSVPTNREDSFNLEAEAVEAAITPASKALLIVTPSNPTAGIVTEDRLRAIADVCIRHNLIVIVDEIYGKIVFPPWRHFSIGSLPGMAERTITLDAFSKTYAMTGWRCGYAAAPVDVIEAMARVKQVTTGPVATVSQWAGLAAITGPQDCVADYLKIYTERRGALLDGLDRMGFAYGEPRGGLFVWADCSSTGIHATELSYLLLKEGRVLIFPGTAFGDAWREYLRITMLEPIETLKTAVARMLPVLERYRLPPPQND
ncbi:MAG: aminotransferase class I/II-fold pyridoxal phosphate-dependent enzyme [Chloroflexota bacterium]|nr:aminotransferase class I/II-fold pyridoxal phosphate-dependent enzyme [Chloroflexota bacterium]MDE2910057.1 aminotransferase class I/II-fold pyridoxal phosphate-dependent enzyme [Chloroflexota bacterium]